jgi:hypothetical protein
MNIFLPARLPVLLFAIATVLIISSSSFGAVTVTVKNNDGAGVGFNDNTPVSPIGGNSGTTLGQQRLIAAQHAANLWGAVLNSNVPIVIGATWRNDLFCATDGATLASAGSQGAEKNFLGAVPFTLYPEALANALSGTDLNGSTVEITARFNTRIGAAGCLPSRTWYYGLDNNHGNSGIDLVTVALHEFGHGLGFSSFTDEETGIQPGATPTIYDRFLLDVTTGKLYSEMSNSERITAGVDTGKLVWIGPQVTASVPSVLNAGADNSNHARVYAPNPVEVGSSVSHWDTTLFPNQLMEPAINDDLTHSVQPPQDLTLRLLLDIGWNNGVTPTPTPTPSPPPNDNFLSAQVITGCSGVVAGTNVGATHEPGEPNHLFDGTGGTHSVWYQWQAPVTAHVKIDTSGSNYDTALAVYTGTAVNGLVAIDKNDDEVLGVVQTSVINFTATAGTIYKIAVDGFDDGDGGDVGPIKLNWNQDNCVVGGLAPQIVLEQSGPAADQAAIFDSILHVRDPFLLVNTADLFLPAADQNTRVVIFTQNLPETFESGAIVNLIDSSNKSFEIAPIDVHQFTDLPFSQVTFRLPNGLSSGTCRVRVFSRSLVSNTATFRIL